MKNIKEILIFSIALIITIDIAFFSALLLSGNMNANLKYKLISVGSNKVKKVRI